MRRKKKEADTRSLPGCLLWILFFVLLYLFSRCSVPRSLPDRSINAILDSVAWGDHNRHTLWFTATDGQPVRIRNDYRQMTRPRYQIGGKYHIQWRSADGDPCGDSTRKVPASVRPGWRTGG